MVTLEHTVPGTHKHWNIQTLTQTLEYTVIGTCTDTRTHNTGTYRHGDTLTPGHTDILFTKTEIH